MFSRLDQDKHLEIPPPQDIWRSPTYRLSGWHGTCPVLGKTSLERGVLYLFLINVGGANPEHIGVYETRGLNCKGG